MNKFKPNPARPVGAAGIARRVAAGVTIVAALAFGGYVDEEDARRASLEKCVARTDYTDSGCDSCYHVIYGKNDLNCGLCYE